MKKEKKVWAMTLIAFWWLAPNKINAQQQDSARLLDEVTVTAAKFSKSVGETGKVLLVIDEAQLQRSTGKDLAQVLNEQVGMVVAGANSNPGKDKSIFLQGAAGQYTLILLDGVPVNDPSGTGAAFDIRLLSLEQVERIEILKGSQSTLYGSDAMAGVINIITKKKAKPGMTQTLTYGSFETVKSSTTATGSTDYLGYNLGYTYIKSRGVSEARDTLNRGFDRDGIEQHSFQGNFNLALTPKLSLQPYARYHAFRGEYDQGAFADDPSARYEAQLFNYGLKGTYTVGQGAITLLYAQDRTQRNFISQFPFSGDGRFQHAEVYVNYDLFRSLQVLAGANVQYLKMIDQTLAEPNPSATIISPYASVFVRNLAGFSAEMGARYNDHSQFGRKFTYSLNPSYLINDQVKLFANWGTGFKAPTLTELFGSFGANRDLQPQQSQSAEAGAQWFSGKKATVRAVYFQRRLTNVIVYSSDFRFENMDRQNDRGFEMEGDLRLSNAVQLRAHYAHVRGTVTTRQPDGRDTTFSNLLRRPAHTVGVFASYTYSRLFISANLKTFSQRPDRFFDLNTFSTKSVTLGRYQLLDVYLEYRLKSERVKFFAEVRNLLNQSFEESAGFTTLGRNGNIGVTATL
ncbi:MAG: TonB-dependent receptor [Cyclobacteriaceae bacterium]|jgi:vitamin B12 transporter|nr:TonB-dependent receptor [Cyclobacteriaceae bacterium]